MLERDPKRRRLLTPLNAPFRSPLRRPTSPTAVSSTTSVDPSVPTNSNPPAPNNSLHPKAYITPNRRTSTGKFRSPVTGKNEEDGLDPEIIALVRRRKELETQIKEEKKALETAEIALQYEKQVFQLTYNSLNSG
jgi:hypothetical protein